METTRMDWGLGFSRNGKENGNRYLGFRVQSLEFTAPLE